MPTQINIINLSIKKKLIYTGILFLFVLAIQLILTGSLHASTSTPIVQAQESYAYQVTKYIELKDKYQTAKSTFLTFKTATAKNDAFQKTKDYLKQIDNVYKAYLLLVEERTNTISWDYASTPREGLLQKIKDEITYFDNNQKDIDASQALEDLPQLAKNIQSHVETTTLKIAFDTLAATDLAQIEEANALFHSDYKLVDDFASPKTKSRELYNNWKTELDKMQANLDGEMEIIKTKPNKSATYNAQNPKFAFDTQKPIDILSSTKTILREILKSI